MHSVHITVTQSKCREKILFFGYKEQKPYKLLSHPCCKLLNTCFERKHFASASVLSNEWLVI